MNVGAGAKKPLHIAAGLLLSAVVGFVAIAGVAKSLDLHAFAANLRSWTLLPSAAQAIVAVAVPLVELVIAFLWLLGPRRLVPHLTVGFLGLATSAYLLHTAFAGPPDCSCFTQIQLFEDMSESVPGMIARNVGLMLLCIPALLLFSRRKAMR